MKATTRAAHRRGARVDFLPRAQGPFAPWDHVIRAADGDGLDHVLDGARVAVRKIDPATSRTATLDLSLTETAKLLPDDLDEVRRPVSYQGMRNYIGRMAMPSKAHESHAGWFESRNEQENYRDLLTCEPVVQMVAQPMRLAWPVGSRIRTHVPDAFHLRVDGQVTLVDVTRHSRLQSPEALAVFRLTQATAHRMGWRYQLRGELTPQHQRNISLIYAHRHPSPSTARWLTRLATMPPVQQIADAARALGAPARPSYSAVWHLVATRHLFLDLAAPLTPDAVIRRRPSPSRSTRCLISR